jgi:isocitrate dehydrogenase
VGPEVAIDDVKATYMPIGRKQVAQLLHLLGENGIEVIKTENLYLFDGVRGFSLGQGE